MARVRALAPLLAAVALAVVAVVTVRGAGCADPGRYESRTGGYELVGGCVAPGDIVVLNPGPPTPSADPDLPARG
ncbi:MAG: hypothetical protein ACRDRH_11890 [Pseudonocardia sp.]